LQWSLGGWILAPEDEEKKEEDYSTTVRAPRSLGDSIRYVLKHPLGEGSARYRNVVNNKDMVRMRRQRHALTSNDEGCYMTELDLEKLEANWGAQHHEEHLPLVQEFADDHSLSTRSSSPGDNLLLMEDPTEDFLQLKKTSSFFNGNSFANNSGADNGTGNHPETQQLQEYNGGNNYNAIVSKTLVSKTEPLVVNKTPAKLGSSSRRMKSIGKSQHATASQCETDSLWETIRNILDRTLFQPPVVGALLGIFCAVTPLRGIFVDLVNRHR